jgi:hypothetical protein
MGVVSSWATNRRIKSAITSGESSWRSVPPRSSIATYARRDQVCQALGMLGGISRSLRDHTIKAGA